MEKFRDFEEEGKQEVVIHYWTDLKNADFDFVIEVYRDILMFGIVPAYKANKKYNLQQLAMGDKSEQPVKN